jgi:hypothetical protein
MSDTTSDLGLAALTAPSGTSNSLAVAGAILFGAVAVGAVVGRDITKVIDAVLAEVPPSEFELRAALKRVKDDAYFRSPETMAVSWERGGATLARSLGSADTRPGTWQDRVKNIWLGRG